MKEVEGRKFHRILGIIVVWFLAGQTLTGLILSIGGMAPGGSPTFLYNILSTLHFGWNPLGACTVHSWRWPFLPRGAPGSSSTSRGEPAAVRFDSIF
jgi:hypothetical protein